MENQEEYGDVLLLLEHYCNRRSIPRTFLEGPSSPSSNRRQHPPLKMKGLSSPSTSNQGLWPLPVYQGPSSGSSMKPAKLIDWTDFCKTIETDSSSSISLKKDQALRRKVPEQLERIAESAPIAEQNLETQDEITQRLVQLIITFGDDINEKLKQSPALQQQLQNLDYNLFAKLTSSVQNLAALPERTAESDVPVQKQRIAWAFEVTSRLSAISVVQRRTALTFGAIYIKENHAGWVQEHGGWEEAFD